MKKDLINGSGNIRVRHAEGVGRCGIVEMMHLDDKNESGCVIGYWKIRKIDGHPFPEFQSVHDRIMKTEYDDPQILLDALSFGQRLAELLIETEEETL